MPVSTGRTPLIGGAGQVLGRAAMRGDRRSLGVDEYGPAGRVPAGPRGVSGRAVSVDADAGAGAHGAADLHPCPSSPPLGSQREPTPAWTVVCVFIGTPVGQPSGSMPAPLPAPTWVMVVMAHLLGCMDAAFSRCRAGPARDRRPRPGKCACSSSAPVGVHAAAAVRIDARAVTGADAGLRAHPPPPLGSMPGPSPALTAVCVLIRHLRWGPWRRRYRCRRVPSCACSSHASRLVADQPPCGSQPEPSPAGSVVRTCMESSPLRGVQPPLGSMKPPSPARSRVMVCMAAFLSRRGGQCRRRRRPGFRS